MSIPNPLHSFHWMAQGWATITSLHALDGPVHTRAQSLLHALTLTPVPQRIGGHKAAVVTATFVHMPNYPVPPVVTASILGKVFLWLPDQGLRGFMHYTINGVDNLPTATSSYLRCAGTRP